MSQRTRVFIAVGIILLIVAGVVGAQFLQAGSPVTPAAVGSPTLAPGSIPITVSGKLIAGFSPDGLNQLKEVSFVDSEEGKQQTGWLLQDVLLLYLDKAFLTPTTSITVSSSANQKSAKLTWAEVTDSVNMVMFDLSGRGTLKLISKGLERLNTRDEWVQDIDEIEVSAP